MLKYLTDAIIGKIQMKSSRTKNEVRQNFNLADCMEEILIALKFKANFSDIDVQY